jgi:hypothetical protein
MGVKNFETKKCCKKAYIRPLPSLRRRLRFVDWTIHIAAMGLLKLLPLTELLLSTALRLKQTQF